MATRTRGQRRIGGVSAVRRCVQNTAAEDLGLNSRDALCLDGEPLVLTSGTHMVACAEYRTSRERFVRVWAKIASGNLWFEAMAPMIFQRVVYDAMLGHMR